MGKSNKVLFSFVTSLSRKYDLKPDIELNNHKLRKKLELSQSSEDFANGGKLTELQTMESNTTCLYPSLSYAYTDEYHIDKLKSSRNEDSITTLDANGSHYVIQNAIYEEIQKVNPLILYKNERYYKRKLDETSGKLSDSHPLYVVLGFRCLEPWSCDVLDESWKLWSGCNFLNVHLPYEWGLSQITLFKKTSDLIPEDTNALNNSIDTFNYVLMAECVNVIKSDRRKVVDFVQSMRASKLPTFVSVYRLKKSSADHRNESPLSLSNYSVGDSGIDSSTIANSPVND